MNGFTLALLLAINPSLGGNYKLWQDLRPGMAVVNEARYGDALLELEASYSRTEKTAENLVGPAYAFQEARAGAMLWWEPNDSGPSLGAGYWLAKRQVGSHLLCTDPGAVVGEVFGQPLVLCDATTEIPARSGTSHGPRLAAGWHWPQGRLAGSWERDRVDLDRITRAEIRWLWRHENWHDGADRAEVAIERWSFLIGDGRDSSIGLVFRVGWDW